MLGIGETWSMRSVMVSEIIKPFDTGSDGFAVLMQWLEIWPNCRQSSTALKFRKNKKSQRPSYKKDNQPDGASVEVGVSWEYMAIQEHDAQFSQAHASDCKDPNYLLIVLSILTPSSKWFKQHTPATRETLQSTISMPVTVLLNGDLLLSTWKLHLRGISLPRFPHSSRINTTYNYSRHCPYNELYRKL